MVTKEESDRLDYIFTVDIFNEGVDIPEVNQVIMLRPTESPIVFVQQLGRGLRKADGKAVKKHITIVCRLLGWESNEVPLNIGGYKFDKNTKTFPVFINYYKEDNIQDTIKYEDHFVNEDTLIAISKQSRTRESEDVQNFLYAEQRGIKVELFVRKNKDDKISKEFYYLGRMKASGHAKEFIMSNTNKTAVELEWILDTQVREDIYEYIVNS